MTPCPCGTNRPIDDCCGPIIAGTPAPTAEALMRARYTAFVTRQIGEFLTATLAHEKRQEFDLRQVEMSARDAEGLGFEVRRTNAGDDDDSSTIEYLARFRIRGQIQSHHELASFRREDGHWLYVDGQVNPKGAPRQGAKVGRNDPCPCGSGNKFKKCCGT